MNRRRVVVTGMGMVSPVGNTVASAWENVLAGNSGIGPIDLFDCSDYGVRFAGQVNDCDVEVCMSQKDARRMDRFMQFGMVAGCEAIEDAGLAECAKSHPHRIGVAYGSGIGGISTIENSRLIIERSGPRKVSPFFVTATVINMIAGNLAIKYGFFGPNIAIGTACTTGVHNIGYAARTIMYGDADVMVAGGAEAAITPLGVACFTSSRALSTLNDNPTGASRPFDKDRDGFVLSEGAGSLVLEELEHARKRGAHIYGELIGFGMSDDGYHITAPPEDGRGAASAMDNAVRDAGIDASAIQYINAHGTSTPHGDIAETRAIKTLLGDNAKQVPVSSTKSMTGHMIGAAGAVEAIFSLKSITDGVIPPTINLENPDPDCDLDYVPHTAREAKIDVALSNSFGFGGTNGSLIFKRID